METEQTTEQVQSDSVADRLNYIAEGLAGEDVPEEEQEQETEEQSEEPLPEAAKAPEPTKIKVKVDGKEDEVDMNTLIAGFQYNAHNTRKAQELADKERELSAKEGLGALYSKMLNDPEFAKHVLTFGDKAPEPDDPISQIKKEAADEAFARLSKVQEEQSEKARLEEIEATRQEVSKDPLYDKVQDALANYVKSLPTEKLRKEMYFELHTNPKAYREMYARARKVIEGPKKEEKKAPPVLMDSGSSGDDTTEQTKAETETKKLKAKFLKTGDPDALKRFFLQPGGLADRLSKGIK